MPLKVLLFSTREFKFLLHGLMRNLIFLLFVLLVLPCSAIAQSVAQAKYGNDFLTAGSGARAMAMGSAQAALASDVTAAYWNVAGISNIIRPQVMYMHSERFGGVVGFDYGAAAIPLKNNQGVISVSFFRQGVDNIANTLNAWDRERNLPKENAEAYITRFSAADMALYFSYAAKKSEHFAYGASAKLVHQKLGPFAQAWGYSLDVGAQFKTSVADFGFAIHDVTTMQKMWQVNESAFGDYETEFADMGAAMPTGQNEYVLPALKAGASRSFTLKDFTITTAADVDVFFENRRAYYLNIGRMSFEPHAGTEVSYKNVISLRAGLTDFVTDPVSGFSISPTLGMGLSFSSLVLDYGFASFAGISSDLGYTHRISLRVDL